jgi:AcrR family transcriptional regulator
MTEASTVYGGSGDPARSLALLWRTRERPGRKGRADLDVDRIVRAAIEIADADGLAALSMRRVADRLGVAVMSLYTYVPGKAELIDVMFDTVCAEADGSAGEDNADGSSADGSKTDEDTADQDTADEDSGWRARLERVARDNWAMYHRHPWMLHVAPNRPVLGPNALAMYERELNAVDGIGLSDVEMDSVVILVAGHVEGAARRSIETAHAERSTGMTDEQWWSAHAPLLAKLVDFRRFPTASRVGSAAGEVHGAAYNPDHAFEFGLQRVLDGIEALVRSRNPAYEGESA